MIKVYKLEENKDDIRIETINLGSAWVPKYTGIRLIHYPTKTVIESTFIDKSAHGNKAECMKRLEQILKYTTE